MTGRYSFDRPARVRYAVLTLPSTTHSPRISAGNSLANPSVSWETDCAPSAHPTLSPGNVIRGSVKSSRCSNSATFKHVQNDTMPPNPLNLKQRLAALTTAASSSSAGSGEQSPRSPFARRRPGFPSIPLRRNTQDSQAWHHSEEELQDILGRVIFQAGVDYESVTCPDIPSSLDEPR